MTRSTVKFIKGLAWGMLVGSAVGMAGCCYMKRHKKGLKRNMSRTLQNMSELIDSMNTMF